MKFGVREICDVVLRAKGTVKVGETTFSHDEQLSTSIQQKLQQLKVQLLLYMLQEDAGTINY